MECQIYIQFFRHKENTCIGRTRLCSLLEHEVLLFLSTAQDSCRREIYTLDNPFPGGNLKELLKRTYKFYLLLGSQLEIFNNFRNKLCCVPLFKAMFPWKSMSMVLYTSEDKKQDVTVNTEDSAI